MGRKARQWFQLANICSVCLFGVLTTQQPTRPELVINAKTTKVLSITIPASLLARVAIICGQRLPLTDRRKLFAEKRGEVLSHRDLGSRAVEPPDLVCRDCRCLPGSLWDQSLLATTAAIALTTKVTARADT